MSVLRWLPTFLAFPLGGLISLLVLGPSSSAGIALAGGVIVGASIGGAQWLALGRLAGPRWLVVTACAGGTGGLLAWLIVGPPTTMAAAAGTGLIIGAVVGIAQALVLPASRLARAIWASTVALSWMLGWVVTGSVIVEIGRGYFIFGSSGAAIATVITGVVLRAILGRRQRTEPAKAASLGPGAGTEPIAAATSARAAGQTAA